MRRLWEKLVSNEHVREAASHPFIAAAFVWRRLMFRTTFIVITGSAGKSTATACLSTILSAHAETNWIPGGRNSRFFLARAILRTRFRHRFTVIEVGTRAPGSLRRAALLIKPDVVLMLRVLLIHSNAFPTLADMAAEKAQLLGRLGTRGAAILNAADPLVAAMATRCYGPVRTFGTAPECDVRVTDVSSKWPARLTFRLHSGDQSATVRTRLVGEQMLSSALGAAAAALYCGVPLAKVAEALSQVQPVAGRMQPMQLPNGATVLRDDFNASLPTFEAALAVLRDATAARRIVVAGDTLDTGLSVRKRARLIGQMVASAADMVVFIGDRADLWRNAAIRAGLNPEAAFALTALPEAAAFLQNELHSGDLVLVKGWIGRHLERLIFAQLGSISCWIARCPKLIVCERCPELKLVPILSSSPPASEFTIR